MKKLFFNLYYWPVFTAITVVGLCILPFLLVYHKVCLGRAWDKGMRRAIVLYGWLLLRPVPWRSIVTINYPPHLPELPFPAILVANHTSAIDPYLLGALKKENSFVTSWPFKIPVYGQLMRLAGYIDSREGWNVLKNQGEHLLHSGSSLTIWPEGHRSRNGQLGRFKKGAFLLSVETGFPIIPVCIAGAEKILAPGEHFLTPGHVTLTLLPPLHPPPKNGHTHESAIALRDQARRMIKETLEMQRGRHLTHQGASCFPKPLIFKESRTTV